MKTGFIGCGNMAGAIIRRIAAKNEIYISGRGPERALALSEETGASVSDKESIAEKCSFIFLGVKPQTMMSVLDEIKDILAARSDRFVLVTMAAGISINRIKELSFSCPVIRIMPNLPVSSGEGMTLYCSDGVSKDELDSFLELMRPTGMLFAVDEDRIDAASAVTGCGPAFAFIFAESLADGAVQCGLPRNQAKLMAAQMLLGSAKLLLEDGRHPGELKDAVCSPGGTTIAGVEALERNAFRAAVAQAVVSSYRRIQELK